MLVSFASVAVSLWLGLVAVACLHHIWRAVAPHGNGHGERDFGRSTRGEHCRDHRWGEPASEGWIPIVCRWVAGVLRAFTDGCRITLSGIKESVLKILQRSHAANPSLSPPSSALSENSNAGTASLDRLEDTEAKVLPPDPPERSIKGNRGSRLAKRPSEMRRESAQLKQRRTKLQPGQKDAEVSRKLSKARPEKKATEKKTRAINQAVTKSTKKTIRSKPAVAAACKPPTTPRISV
jgi:hypothetical protein